jgi:hypothetical protein
MAEVQEGQEEEVITAEGLQAALEAGDYRNLEPGDVERIQEQLAEGGMNPILLARYIGVRPQMIYQAIRDGKLTAVTHNNTQKQFIRLAEAIAYAAKYLDRKRQRDLEALREEQLQQKAS